MERATPPPVRRTSRRRLRRVPAAVCALAAWAFGGAPAAGSGEEAAAAARPAVAGAAVVDLESELILEAPGGPPHAVAERLRALGAGVEARVYSLTGEVSPARVVGAPGEVGGCTSRWVDVAPRPAPGPEPHLAVVAPWDPRPRTPRSALEDARVRALLDAEVARAVPWVAGLEIDPIVVVDLEGDGTEEVVASLSNFPWNEPTFTGTGFEATWIHRPGRKEAPWSEYGRRVVVCEAPPCVAIRTYLVGLLDVDGDGVLEPLVSSRSSAGESLVAWDADGDGRTLLAAHCAEGPLAPGPAGGDPSTPTR